MIDTEKLLNNLDIKQVIETYTGRRLHGNHTLCPFHNDRNNPSLSIKTETGTWRCFTCNAGGNAINFARLYFGLDFIGACRRLSEDFNVRDIGIIDSGEQSECDIWDQVEWQVRQQRLQDLKKVREDIDGEINAMTVIHRAMLKSGADEEALTRYTKEIDALEAYKNFWR